MSYRALRYDLRKHFSFCKLEDCERGLFVKDWPSPTRLERVVLCRSLLPFSMLKDTKDLFV